MGAAKRMCAIVTAVALAGAVWAPSAGAQGTMHSMQPETVREAQQAEVGTGPRIGAAVLNVVYVPGKAITCTAGTLVAGGLMLATFGSAYRESVSFFKEGCGGSWFLTPEQVAAAAEVKRVQLQP